MSDYILELNNITKNFLVLKRLIMQILNSKKNQSMHFLVKMEQVNLH